MVDVADGRLTIHRGQHRVVANLADQPAVLAAEGRGLLLATDPETAVRGDEIELAGQSAVILGPAT